MQKEFINYYDRRHCDIVSVVKDPKDDKSVRFSMGHEEGGIYFSDRNIQIES